ncbi:MAG: hypothetical protein MNPFHGCM_02278 [Gemmatimonadaceae bacterium]|nr:hypothetical protein [Gemmatimonadaceae bacterium]
MKNSHSLLVLEPPYAMVRWLRDDAPAMGSVLLVDAAIRDVTMADLRVTMDVTPWCPVCVLSAKRLGGRGVRRIPRSCQVASLDTLADPAAAILRAVDDRPRPTPSTLVEWIVRRARAHAVGRTLSDLFSRPLLSRTEASFLSYPVREHLATLGTWSAIDWQYAAQFAEYAADRTSLNRLLLDPVGSRDTLQRMQELLGIDEQQFRASHGWEWVLEASLRRSGFFETRVPDVRRLTDRRSAVAAIAAGQPAFARPRYSDRRQIA